MLSYYLKCRKNTEIKNPKIVSTRKAKMMLLSKCSVFNSKKWKFIKEQEPKGLPGKLVIRAPLSQIPLSGPILF